MEKKTSPKTDKRYSHSVLYSVALFLYRVLFFGIFLGKVNGREHVPAGGSLVFMCNHIHALDPFTMGICVPKRQTHFLGKKELFKLPFFAKILRSMHVISVDRGQFDLAAMRECSAVLRAGEVLGIFPEGHRGDGKELGPLLSGAAVLALRSDAPVVPVFIMGKYRPFGGLRAMIGAPIEIDDLRAKGADKEAADIFLQRMRSALDALRQRGARQ